MQYFILASTLGFVTLDLDLEEFESGSYVTFSALINQSINVFISSNLESITL